MSRSVSGLLPLAALLLFSCRTPDAGLTSAADPSRFDGVESRGGVQSDAQERSTASGLADGAADAVADGAAIGGADGDAKDAARRSDQPESRTGRASSAPNGFMTPDGSPELQSGPAPSPEALLPPPPPIGLLAEGMDTRRATAIADSVYERLSPREQVGQLFISMAYGRFRTYGNGTDAELERLVETGEIGGIIFMRGDVYAQAALTNRMQERARVPLWISQDMEFGAAMRVDGTTRFTPAMGIGSTGDPVNAYIKGRVTGLEARALGVHQVYAPVLDVNNNPDNPVINTRSYSADPDAVAEYGIQFIRGIQSAGVLATAKHFPGHGDTDTDSHLDLPVVRHDYARLAAVELAPFRRSIESGDLRSVMTAHIAFPEISRNPDRPVTLDPDVLRRILTDSLGFDGVVVTDALEMRAISRRFSPGRAAVEAFKAGADMLLASPDVPTAIDEMLMAVQSGEIDSADLQDRVLRVLRLKAEHGLFDRTPIDLDALSGRISTLEYTTQADRIARESVTIVRNDGSVLPLRDVAPPEILLLAVDDDRSGRAGNALAGELRRYHQDVVYEVLDLRSGPQEREEILRKAEKADLVLIATFISVRTGGGSQMDREHLRLLRRVSALPNPSVLVSFGNPYLISELPETQAAVLAWSGTDEQVVQTVPALVGAAPVEGRLQVDIPGVALRGSGIQLPKTTLRVGTPESAGMRSDSLRRIDELIEASIRDSVFPGAVVGVVRDGVLVWNKAYGYHEYSKTRRVETRTVYDLASLTKVAATTSAIMKLVDQGRVGLDDPVGRYIPEFSDGEHAQVTIRHLLSHTSGLAPFRIYVDSIRTREEIVNAVRNEPLEHAPGSRYVYSDLGFILLGEIVQAVDGRRLDRFVREELHQPLGMATAYFNPYQVGRWVGDLTVPTEVDEVYGRGVVRGRVHDERAYYMDGVSGHAGLFAATRDLAIWATMIQNGGAYGGKQHLSPETVALFTSLRDTVSGRGYGFDLKSRPNRAAGSRMGDLTFGHTGFTGTSIWMDPESKLTVILLTNRTWPNRSYGGAITTVRGKVADLAVGSLADGDDNATGARLRPAPERVAVRQ